MARVTKWFKLWLLKFAILASQALNAIIFDGNPDETLSARCYRLEETRSRYRWSRMVIDWVFLYLFRQVDHCHQSHKRDRAFAAQVLSAGKRCSHE